MNAPDDPAGDVVPTARAATTRSDAPTAGGDRADRLGQLIVTSSADAGGRGISSIEPEYRLDAERTISRLATTLAGIHRVPIEPIGLRTDTSVTLGPGDLIRQAEQTTGEVGTAYRHMTRERLLHVLREGAAAIATPPADLVLVQGSPTLANLRFDGPDAIGFEDWSGAALGDRYLDLAIAARDVAAIFGPAPIQAFFGEYGLELPDPVRLDWYLLAAELVA